MKKKIYEYMTVVFAVMGTLAMVSAVGAIETDQYLLGASAVCVGFASFVMALVGISTGILTIILQSKEDY